MDYLDILVIILLFCMSIVLFVFYKQNINIMSKNRHLKELVEIKNSAIEEYIDSMSSIEESNTPHSVMSLHESGESIEHIAKKLSMTKSKVELVVKFDKIRKRD